MDLQGLTYSVSCDQRTGIKEVYLFKTSEVDSITFDATSREATAITMLTTKQGYKVEIDDDESSLVSTMAFGRLCKAGTVRLVWVQSQSYTTGSVSY
jgi:hypothetical protein